jgi:hypothetical protein
VLAVAVIVTSTLQRAILHRFNVGKNTVDWDVQIELVEDDMLTEFYDMIEHPERRMPGSWASEHELSEEGFCFPEECIHVYTVCQGEGDCEAGPEYVFPDVG